MEKNTFFDVPEDIPEKAGKCLRSVNPSLGIALIVRKSDHPEDSRLYLVLGSYGNGNRYTVHTYNASTDSLNGGCYNLTVNYPAL